MNAARGAAPRALHIRIYPGPRDVGESRAVLRELRRHSDITTYKSLKYDHNAHKHAPNSALAICSTIEGATRLLGRSPVSVKIEPILPLKQLSKLGGGSFKPLFESLEAADPDVKDRKDDDEVTEDFQPSFAKEEDIVQSQSLEDMDSPITEAPYIEESDAGASNSTFPFTRTRRGQFLIHASPWRGDLNLHLERSPYTGSFSIDKNAFAQQELAQTVPLLGLTMISLKHSPVSKTAIDARRLALEKRSPLRSAAPQPGEVVEADLRDLMSFMRPVAHSTVIKDGSWQDLTEPELTSRLRSPPRPGTFEAPKSAKEISGTSTLEGTGQSSKPEQNNDFKWSGVSH